MTDINRKNLRVGISVDHAQFKTVHYLVFTDSKNQQNRITLDKTKIVGRILVCL